MKLLAILVVLAGLVLNGCNPGSTTDSSSGQFNLGFPEQLRAIDPEALQLEITINEVAYQATRNQASGNWEVALTLETGPVNISVLWFVRLSGITLPLATYNNQSIQVTDQNQVIAITPTNYDYAHDFDNDEFSNYAELSSTPATDPLIPDDEPPQTQGVDVTIPRISQAEAPTIDGLSDDIWETARFSDENGEVLRIDSLMIDQGADRYTGERGVPFRWAAMHDTKKLYIMVYGEFVDSAHINGDSVGKPWNDDSVEIFFDPDYSRLQEYDRVDDLSVIIPMLDAVGSANASTSSTGIMIKGANSAYLVEAEYAVCLCPNGQHRWEISFSLPSLWLPVNSKFGIEIEINDDVDGGDRDGKWGWVHPARVNNVDTDEAFKNPSILGTGFLQ